MSWPAALAEPPVAMRSSTITTREPGLIALFWISKVSYNQAYEIHNPSTDHQPQNLHIPHHIPWHTRPWRIHPGAYQPYGQEQRQLQDGEQWEVQRGNHEHPNLAQIGQKIRNFTTISHSIELILTNNSINLLLVRWGQVVDNVSDKSLNGGGVLEHWEHVLEDDSLCQGTEGYFLVWRMRVIRRVLHTSLGKSAWVPSMDLMRSIS